MGHIRLGNLPRTRNWIQVIELIASDVGTPEIAASTMNAAQGGLFDAAKDRGLVYSFWLLTKIPLAARESDFAAGLRRIGLKISDKPDLLEVVGSFTDAVDAYLQQNGGRTDLGEMAEMAVAESLTVLGAERTRSLFETTPDDVHRAFREFSKSKQFGVLAKEFFARLTYRYLGYFLSRELPNHIGGDGRFFNIDDHAEFNDALSLHCRQAAYIVETFAGGWFSKTNYEGGISPAKAAGFLHVALGKLRDELAKRDHADG